jgi:putative CocE/NonD family hydrolase
MSKVVLHAFQAVVASLATVVSLGAVAAPGHELERPATYGMRIDTAGIRMPDGVELSADLYMPTGGKSGERYPVLLEYLPYRKMEGRSRNYPLYSYFVQRGYVLAAVDIRGTGNSQGRLIPYEYSDIEHEDGESVIAWLARQPWSNGNVGMFGISWGGFNSIQMALRNPPALKAIIAIDATEDLYEEDVHFIDGIIHVDSWEMSQDLDNARPGAPDYVIDEAYFRDRFDTPPWMLTYKRQQRDGAFWDRASAKGRYDQIRVPSFFIGGWYDGYRDSVPRMLEHLRAPVKAIVGPWSHAWPNEPYPKPGMEWRREAVRWFDQWLRGIDTGILDEPRFAVYVRDWHAPGPFLETAPGHWRYEDGWPIARVQPQRWYPQPDHGLRTTQSADTEHELRNVPSIGYEAGGPVMWWGDVAHDQRGTDAYSLVYDSEPLAADTEILGMPRALLSVAADAPRANWFVRVSDVAPDGTVTQVAGAGFNGTHRESAREPAAIVPGQTFELTVDLHFTSWTFPKGHRIRVAVNNSQWPMLWPSAYPLTSMLNLGARSSIELPIVPHAQRPVPAFAPPAKDPSMEGYATLDAGTSSGYGEISSVDRNPQTGEVTIKATNSGGQKYPWGEERYHETIEHRVRDDEPQKASMIGSHRMEVSLPGRELVWEAKLEFRSDRDSFHYDYTRRLLENGKLVREKSWHDVIPRDFQ